MEKTVTVKSIDEYCVNFTDQTGAHKSAMPKDVKPGDRFRIRVNDDTNRVEKIVRV